MKQLEENSKYIFNKPGYISQFNYTPLYTNYESSSPREVPVGAKLNVYTYKSITKVYDGMPVSEETFSGIISGYELDNNYGNSESTKINLMENLDILNYIQKIEKD